MKEELSDHRLSIARLILVPGVITLLVTAVRLVGELRQWSATWFSTRTQGVVPSGWSWVIGITWLALPFGIYFALRLAGAGRGPVSLGKALLCAVLGLIVVYLGLFVLSAKIPLSFPSILLYIWAVMAAGAALQYFAWPALFKTLLAYGLAARLPVVLVMLLAMRGSWGTHYDYVGMPAEFQMNLLPRFFWLAFFPQLIFWVGFTILAGSFAGLLATSIFRKRMQAAPVVEAESGT